MFDPFAVPFRGLVSLLVLAGGITVLTRWADRLPTEVPVEARRGDGAAADQRPVAGFGERVSAWHPGFDWTTAALVGGAGMVFWSVGGQLLGPRVWQRTGTDDPTHERGGEAVQVKRPDGTTLHVELYGPADAPPVVLTHGWGGDGTEWYYLKKALAPRFRLIVWDLPGLGLSSKPADNDYALDKLAGHLAAVLDLAGGKPAVLVGHSIGGMTSLTFCKLFPEALGSKVAGLVLIHTTPTNPVFTKKPTWLLPAIQKPLLEPLCWAVVGLSPVVWSLTLWSYVSGSAHRSNHKSLFAGTESRGQLEFSTRFIVKASPAVLARGTLAMFRYDATQVLPRVTVPTLVVAADQDITTIPEASKQIAAGVPGATLATLAPAKHLGLIEHHAEVSRLVEAFCDRHAGRA